MGISFIYPSGRPIEIGDEAKILGTSTVGTIVGTRADRGVDGVISTYVVIEPFPSGDRATFGTHEVEFVPRRVMVNLTEDHARALRTILLQRDDVGHGVVPEMIKALDKALGD